MLKMLQNHEQLRKVSYDLKKVYRSLLDIQVNHWNKLKRATFPEFSPEELQP